MTTMAFQGVWKKVSRHPDEQYLFALEISKDNVERSLTKAHTLVNPNRIRINSNVPSWMTNAVFCLAFLCIFICQFPEYMSSDVRYCDLPNVSIYSSILANDTYP